MKTKYPQLSEFALESLRPVMRRIDSSYTSVATCPECDGKRECEYTVRGDESETDTCGTCDGLGIIYGGYEEYDASDRLYLIELNGECALVDHGGRVLKERNAELYDAFKMDFYAHLELRDELRRDYIVFDIREDQKELCCDTSAIPDGAKYIVRDGVACPLRARNGRLREGVFFSPRGSHLMYEVHVKPRAQRTALRHMAADSRVLAEIGGAV